MAAATLRILARNIESDGFTPTTADAFSPLKLRFSDFSIELLDQSKRRRLDEARKFFRDAMFDECLIEREYDVIPSAPRAYGGFGTIPNDGEDLLLLLRLFRPGDLAFVSMGMQKPGDHPVLQYPYRVISNSVFSSSQPFRIDCADVPEFEAMASSLKSSDSWNSSWFGVARRWFLYGGAKEFNPNFESDVDRVADNMAALEATLVPKSDLFVQRQLKERAVRLLGLSGAEAKATKKILTRFYAIRSTLVHGSPVSDEDLAFLQDRERWREFEKLVRDLLRAALLNVPADDGARVAYLTKLYTPSDDDRAEDLEKNFRAIKNQGVRRDLLAKLGNL